MGTSEEDSTGTDRREADSTSERVTFSVTVEDGATVITMRGDRDTAVIVRSSSGERIYLPPEDFEREATLRDDGSYQSARDASPYRGTQSGPYQAAESESPYQAAESESPYQAARQRLPEQGLVSTADGYRIRHPEPVTDVRVLR
jgi:hypothetical protein